MAPPTNHKESELSGRLQRLHHSPYVVFLINLHTSGCCCELLIVNNMSGCSNIEASTRRLIVGNIEKRNLREKEPFELLILTCKVWQLIKNVSRLNSLLTHFFIHFLYSLLFQDNKLFDAVSELRHEILVLTIQNEKLRQEGLQLQSGSSDSKAHPEKSSVW